MYYSKVKLHLKGIVYEHNSIDIAIHDSIVNAAVALVGPSRLREAQVLATADIGRINIDLDLNVFLPWVFKM